MNDGSRTALPARLARAIFIAGALGEIGVGLMVFAFPEVLAWLFAAPFDRAALLVCRMAGAAVLALGATWWIARREPLPHLISHHAAGFLIYNLGAAVVFAFRALAAAQSALPWLVAALHLLVGVGFAVATAAARRATGNVVDR